MMDLDALEASPIGRLVPIDVIPPGDPDGASKYWAYIPDPLPDSPRLCMTSIVAAERAAVAVARVDQAVSQLPNFDLLLRPIIRREATSTSALEGTYADFDEVLEADFLDERHMSSEQREIHNFVRATDVAAERLQTLPISRRMLGELQSTIVRNTPGDSYDAGDLRQRQVYIGPKNRPVEDARFIPCPPGDELAEGFSSWEKWIHLDGHLPMIAGLALAHYQFETLHPYADGNGRLGRLVVLLQMMEKGQLRSPMLNISPWLEERRTRYIDLLLETTCSGDYDPWVQFFAEAVETQAAQAAQTIRELLTYRDEVLATLRLSGVRGSALQIAEQLIGYPVLDVGTAKLMIDKSFEAANQAVARLVEHNVLREVTGKRMNRIFACPTVIAIVNRRPTRS